MAKKVQSKKKSVSPVKKVDKLTKNQSVKKTGKQENIPIIIGKKQRKNNASNLKGKGFESRPENINKNGRPPKLLAHIINELKAQGYERVTPSQVQEGYELLFNLNQKQITNYVGDIKSPMFLRIIAKAMLGGKGPEMLEKMLDRAHGKSMQKTELDLTVKKDTNIPVIAWVKTDETNP